MKTTFAIHKLFVQPSPDGASNIIGKVLWAVQFEDGGAISEGAGETLLDAPVGEFTPFEQVTEAQVIGWVIEKEGGQPFVDMLVSIHTPMLETRKREMLLRESSLPFTPSVLQQAAPPSASTVSEIYQGPKAVAGIIPTIIL